jgi:hypothetical protein
VGISGVELGKSLKFGATALSDLRRQLGSEVTEKEKRIARAKLFSHEKEWR